MKKLALALVTLISIGAQAQFPGPFRPHHGPPEGGRPVRCTIVTEHGHAYDGFGPSCRDAALDAAASCSQGRGAVSSRCYNAAQGQSQHYRMMCDSGC